MTDDGARGRCADAPVAGPGSDPADAPYDPDLPRMAGRSVREGGGVLSRELKAAAATRRHRAKRMRHDGDKDGAVREEHDAAYLERHADRFRDPEQAIGGPLAAGNGGEVVAERACSDPFQERVREPPDLLAAEATEHRLNLTSGVSNAALTLA
ncbi:MAG: hypothetical protein ICV73_24850, partial [Acetobacteraceae bacterium]|nr:hypothetical protein [Acetobacteraceae bacterium]